MQQIKRITSNTKESIRIVTHLPARYIVQITDNQLILVKQTVTEYHFIVLIIWRSLVQAQDGPLKETLN